MTNNKPFNPDEMRARAERVIKERGMTLKAFAEAHIMACREVPMDTVQLTFDFGPWTVEDASF